MEWYSDCGLGLGTLRHLISIFMKARPAAELPKIGSSAPVQTLVRGTCKTFVFHHTDVFGFQCKDILGSSAPVELVSDDLTRFNSKTSEFPNLISQLVYQR